MIYNYKNDKVRLTHKTTSLIRANMYTSVIWLSISRGKFLRRPCGLCMISADVREYCQNQEVNPYVISSLFMSRRWHIYHLRQKESVETWMKFLYGLWMFLADGQVIFFFKNSDKWPVGQQINPLSSGLTYSSSPTRWPTTCNWWVGYNSSMVIDNHTYVDWVQAWGLYIVTTLRRESDRIANLTRLSRPAKSPSTVAVYPSTMAAV